MREDGPVGDDEVCSAGLAAQIPDWTYSDFLDFLKVPPLAAGAGLGHDEFAIHAALGGTRLGILRQLTVEHVALAALASAVGLGLAALIGSAVLAAAPIGLMSVDGPAVSARVAAFALVVSLVTPLLFGLVPILAASAVKPADGLAQSGFRYTPGRRWSHRVAVTVQVARALVLVTGATMFGETMMRLTTRPLGFVPGTSVSPVSGSSGPRQRRLRSKATRATTWGGFGSSSCVNG